MSCKHYLGIFISLFVLAVGDQHSCPSNNEDENCSESLKEKILRKRARERAAIDQINKDLSKHIDAVSAACGQVCDTSITGKKGKFFDEVEKDFQCRRLFESPDLYVEKSVFDKPPRRIPDFLLSNFTHNGRARKSSSFRDDSVGIGHKLVWTTSDIEDRIRSGSFRGSYGAQEDANVFFHMKQFMELKDKDVLVIGSQIPWLESMALYFGARNVTTLEYVPIKSKHPKVHTMTPTEMAQSYLRDQKPEFDVVLSFSSLEHSGLGRYGDSLNPWGDLMTMARAWCITKPGGEALIGVPTGPDLILFNEARIYGQHLLGQLFANWKVKHTDVKMKYLKKKDCDFCTAYQPLFVLQKL